MFHLESSIQQNDVWIAHIWNLNFWMTLDEETTKKIVDLEKLCNLIVVNFFIWIIYKREITFNFLTFESHFEI